jgi:hypothetical protein
MTSNLAFDRSAQKHRSARFWVPSSLRSSAPGQCSRWTPSVSPRCAPLIQVRGGAVHDHRMCPCAAPWSGSERLQKLIREPRPRSLHEESRYSSLTRNWIRTTAGMLPDRG